MQFLETINHIYNQFVKCEITYLLCNKVVHEYNVCFIQSHVDKFIFCSILWEQIKSLSEFYTMIVL